MPVEAFHLWRSTSQTFAGRIILLGNDHDPGRGSWSWQRIMTLAEDHDLGRQACSCWNNVWFGLRTKNRHSGTTSELPLDHFRPNLKIDVQVFVDQSGVKIWPPGARIISERGTKKTHSYHVQSRQFTAWAKTISELNIWTWKKSKASKKSKILGMVRDALGSVGGSSLSVFTGFSKNFEKLKIRKLKKLVETRLKCGQNTFKNPSKIH